MPKRQDEQKLFTRWLLMVYLPLGAFALGAVLVVLQVISGAAIIPVGLLGAYAVIPARALLETKRKGLAFPRPPGAKAKGDANAAARRTGPARDRGFSPEGGPGEAVVSPEGGLADAYESGARRPVAAAKSAAGGRRAAPASTARAGAARPSAQILRRRALAGIVGIVALLLLGGILVIVGIGRVTSSLGLVMVGVGGFLMILSVTLPTFRLVDAALRGLGRLVSRRKPAPPGRQSPAKQGE